jgi:hypothetical protein
VELRDDRRNREQRDAQARAGEPEEDEMFHLAQRSFSGDGRSSASGMTTIVPWCTGWDEGEPGTTGCAFTSDETMPA